jgi:hypothetical protein
LLSFPEFRDVPKLKISAVIHFDGIPIMNVTPLVKLAHDVFMCKGCCRYWPLHLDKMSVEPEELMREMHVKPEALPEETKALPEELEAL